jgi:hypothetical protein
MERLELMCLYQGASKSKRLAIKALIESFDKPVNHQEFESILKPIVASLSEVSQTLQVD